VAHFRAVIKGQRGVASRLGTKNSGISTLLQTWGWDVSVSVKHDASTKQDMALVEIVQHGTGKRIPLLSLELSVDSYEDVVSFVYRTVVEQANLNAREI
jgi:hypothetical protein